MREGSGRTSRVITRIRMPDGEAEHGHFCTVLRYKTLEEAGYEIEQYLTILGASPEEPREPKCVEHDSNLEASPPDLSNPAVRETMRTRLTGVATSANMKVREAARTIRKFLDGWECCGRLSNKTTKIRS